MQHASTTCLCHDSVVNAAAALIGEHRERARAVLEASDIAHDQAFNEAHNILSLQQAGQLKLADE